MEKNKKYNVVLGLMIFFFILFVGVCVAWRLGFIGLKSNVDSTITDNNTQLSNNTNTTTNTETIKDESAKETEMPKETIKEVAKEVAVNKMLAFDYTKCKNSTEVDNYNGAIAHIYNDGEKEMLLLIYSNGEAKVKVGEIEVDYPINGVKGKVKDGMFGSFLTGDTSIYLLLENGTVQKVSDFSMFKQVGFTADAVIEGVNNIVRLETIVNAGGKRIPIAIDKDGYYYGLN